MKLEIGHKKAQRNRSASKTEWPQKVAKVAKREPEGNGSEHGVLNVSAVEANWSTVRHWTLVIGHWSLEMHP